MNKVVHCCIIIYILGSSFSLKHGRGHYTTAGVTHI